jgi:hypothetical protein
MKIGLVMGGLTRKDGEEGAGDIAQLGEQRPRTGLTIGLTKRIRRMV